MSTYEDIRKLNDGGSADVWLCRKPGDDSLFAKKVLTNPTDTEELSRFVREVRLLERLEHPHIVKVLSAQLDHAPHYYVMPYYLGCLRDHIDSLVGDQTRIQTIFERILDAMQYAHEHGVIHRDIKPSNVLMNSDTDLVIADFGLGRALDAATTRRTSTGGAFGTPIYMAPEQLTNAKNSDERSDIFSLGQLLMHIYTGSFGGLLSPGQLPTPMVLLINTCIQNDPGRRFQSISQLRRAWNVVVAPPPAPAPGLSDVLTLFGLPDGANSQPDAQRTGEHNFTPRQDRPFRVRIRVTDIKQDGRSTSQMRSAFDLLQNVPVAGPQQPDFGLTPQGVGYLQDFASQWEDYAELHLWGTLDLEADGAGDDLLYAERDGFLQADHGMMQVWFEILDSSSKPIGRLTAPNIATERQYNIALSLFLSRVGLDVENLVRIRLAAVPLESGISQSVGHTGGGTDGV